ncbi:MAG: tetratricopeptide repeat protein [Magnetococcales bacterium]|nr:tetratricopeptide repeat protein [Magnetococcales bacterium]
MREEKPSTNGQTQLTVDAAYGLAIENFNAGRYTEADKLCTAIIQTIPGNIEAINLLGVIAQKLNRHDLAVEQFQKAVNIDNNRALLYYNLGVSLYQLGQIEESIKVLNTALEMEPENSKITNYLNNILNNYKPNTGIGNTPDKAIEALQKGISYHQSGKLDDAINWYKKVLEIQQENTAALSNMGAALQAIGKLNEAVISCQKAISIKPDYADAYYNLGNALKEQGKLGEAVASFQKAISIKSDYADAHSNLGIALQKQGKLDEAVASYQKAISIKPDYAFTYSNLGVALQEQGKLNEAVASYQKAIFIKPDYTDAYSNLGNTLKEQGKLDEAVASCQKAITIKPDYADAYYNLGNALKEQGKLDEAVKNYQRAISIIPDYTDAYYNLGITLNEQGKLDEAVASYQKAISIKPDYADAYYNISNAKKFTDISETQVIKDVLNTAKTNSDKIFLNFALGKAMVDINCDSQAFKYYLTGNQLKRAGLEFDISETAKTFNKFQKTFDKSFFESRMGFGDKDKTPIFILGMPRSGSTLIEQILSSHPDVYGAGELSFIKKNILQKISSNSINMVPNSVSRFTSNDFAKLGSRYINNIREIEPKIKFITDKMPENYLYIGVIKLMLPNAKIIHSVRSPEDTCLSIFRTNFIGTHNYAYDLIELGQYYRQYSNLMAHWHKIFPGTIYDIEYENLTVNQESETRKLIEFCGLDWNDRCLSFHNTVRNVKTASNYQVRQPMYTSSVNGWKRFEKQLQPLLKALKG